MLDVFFGGLAAGDFLCNVELKINIYIANFFFKGGSSSREKMDSRNSSHILPKLCPFSPFQIPTVQERYWYWLDQGPLFERRFWPRRPSKRAGFVVTGENFINPNKFH